MKHRYPVLIIFLLTCTIKAQNYVDLFRTYANTTPENAFDSSASTTKVNEFFADLTLPVKLNDKSSIVTGVIYERTQTKLFPEQEMVNFASLTVKLGINQVFNDRWSGSLILLPKLASDFKSIGAEDFQFGVFGLMKYKKDKNLSYKFGLYYNAELFGPLFIPMIGFYYMSENKKLEANITAPLLADINYKLIPLLNVGFYYSGLVRSYHLHDVTPQLPSTYVTKWSNEVYLYLRLNITKSMLVQLKVGQSVGRRYRIFEMDDRVTLGLPAAYVGTWRQQLNTDFANGLLLRVAFIYRFNLE